LKVVLLDDFFYFNPMKNKVLLFVFIATQSIFAQTVELDNVLDQWHKHAATAKLEDYFGLVTSDFVFLGTAPGERWGRDAFYTFCKPYFDAGKAWEFVPSNRNWVFSKNRKMAWFDEDLQTWMEGCRGSGILIKKKGEWKIAYYNLTVLIENEKIESFIQLRKGD
jgi:hypothetical protein